MLKNSEFVSKLRNSGLRPTKQRLKICEVLFNRDKTFHFTINDLAKNISQKFNEKISLATIYNTIHAFKDKGYLKDVELNKIADFESALISYMNSEHKDFMDNLAESGEHSDEILATFTEALDKFKSTQTW